MHCALDVVRHVTCLIVYTLMTLIFLYGVATGAFKSCIAASFHPHLSLQCWLHWLPISAPHLQGKTIFFGNERIKEWVINSNQEQTCKWANTPSIYDKSGLVLVQLPPHHLHFHSQQPTARLSTVHCLVLPSWRQTLHTREVHPWCSAILQDLKECRNVQHSHFLGHPSNHIWDILGSILGSA